MTILIEDDKGIPVVKPKGDLTARAESEFAEAVHQLLGRDEPRVVIDLSEVGMVNSSTLGDLVKLTAQANTLGGRIILANPPPFVSDVLKTTKLDKFFDVAASSADAVATLAKQQSRR